MAYRLGDLDDVPSALRRSAAERLDHAAAALEAGADDPATAVHTARKDLKKTRSLLRLARPAMPRKARRRTNDALRDVAAALAGARDADAQVEAVNALREHGAGRLPEQAFTDLAAASAGGGEGGPAADLGAAAARLRELARDAERWPVGRADRATLADGIALAYARGVDALAAAEGNADSEALHEWRKRVKDLWYHARLLRDAAPEPFRALAEDAGALADVLGDEHDLALLAARLEDPDDPASHLALDQDALRGLVAGRRRALRAEAARLAGVLHAERPKAFRRRIGALLDPAPVDLGLPGDGPG